MNLFLGCYGAYVRRGSKVGVSCSVGRQLPPGALLEEGRHYRIDLPGSVVQPDQFTGIVVRHLATAFGTAVLVDVIGDLAGYHEVMSHGTAYDSRQRKQWLGSCS